MRDRFYVIGFLLAATLLLYAGRGLLQRSAAVTLGLTFAGTTAAGVLAMALYRVQLELRGSRLELGRRQAELDVAREVQQALFPRQFPSHGGLEFSGICVPARGIGGDYYDVLPLTDGRLVFAVADISGKGISAAILMANLHAVLRTLARDGRSPSEVCAQLNRHLYQVSDGTRFATFFYAEWNPKDRGLSYLNAGHNAPILFRARRGQRLTAKSPPLGIFPEAQFEVCSLTLQPGDTLILFSDGVTEAGIDKDNEFGDSRLETVVASVCEQPLGEIQRQVLDSVHKWAGQELEDDMTLLLVRAVAPAKEAV